MRRIMLFSMLLSLVFALSCGKNGLVSRKSSADVKTTSDRLEKIITEKGMKIFARIDHAAGAKKAGLELRPTELIIFGNPKVGTLLMKCSRSAAIDLPQKILVWQDQSGQVWLTYNDPLYLAKRHNIRECDGVIKKISAALKTFTDRAAVMK